MDTSPRRTETAVPTPQGREAPKGADENTKGAGRTLLPARIRTRCNSPAPVASRPGPERPSLVMRQRRAPVSISPFLSSVEGGDRRSDDSGRELGGIVGGVERLQSDASSAMHGRHPRSWSFWRIQGWGGCLAGCSWQAGRMLRRTRWRR